MAVEGPRRRIRERPPKPNTALIKDGGALPFHTDMREFAGMDVLETI